MYKTGVSLSHAVSPLLGVTKGSFVDTLGVTVKTTDKAKASPRLSSRSASNAIIHGEETLFRA